MQATATTYTTRSAADSTDMATIASITPTKLTDSILAVFVNDTTSEGNSRVRQFCTLACNTTRAEFNEAKKNYLASVKPGETVPEDDPAHAAFSSARVRMSELASIYTAYIDCGYGYALENLGYHAAVKLARAVLKDHGIGPNGKPKGTSDDSTGGASELALHKQATKAALKLPHSSVEQLNALIEEQKEVLRMEHEEKLAEKRQEAVSKQVKAILEKGDAFATSVALDLLSALGYDVENIEVPMYEQATM